MTQLSDNRIIAPPIEEEVYPYRRVWRSISVQFMVMSIMTVGIFFLGDILELQFQDEINILISYILALTPLALWLLFSVLAERFVVEPRSHLVSIAIISGLTAAAIGIPFAQDIFQTDRWLPLESVFQRILGFTMTIGILASGIRFIVVRYFIIPEHLRIRTDTIAYFFASSIGYSTVLNFYLISETQALYAIVMVYIFANYVTQMSSGFFLAYGLSATFFNNAISLVMPFNILFSSLIVGIISTFVTSLMNGPLATTGNSDRPIFSITFLIMILFIFSAITFFLYSVAEQREKEAFATSES